MAAETALPAWIRPGPGSRDFHVLVQTTSTDIADPLRDASGALILRLDVDILAKASISLYQQATLQRAGSDGQ